jgi:hypothetical protein
VELSVKVKFSCWKIVFELRQKVLESPIKTAIFFGIESGQLGQIRQLAPVFDVTGSRTALTGSGLAVGSKRGIIRQVKIGELLVKPTCIRFLTPRSRCLLPLAIV